jgi:hypothetical protein
LLAETASSLQVLDMPLVEIDDEDMRVLFNLAMRCHTLRICESMKIDQTLPFLKATVRPRLQGRLHCRYHCRYHCSFTICNLDARRLLIKLDMSNTEIGRLIRKTLRNILGFLCMSQFGLQVQNYLHDVGRDV